MAVGGKERQPERAGARTYAGLFGVTLATLMLQVLLTRIFSVTLWYHFAFMAISIAMFGLSAGATWVFLSPRRFSPERTEPALASCALAFALSTAVCFFVHLKIPYLTGTGTVALTDSGAPAGSFASTVAYLGLTYAVIAVPFVFSGAVVCLALTRFPLQIGRLYAADLTGAGLGCLLVVALLRVADAPVAVIAVAGIAAVAAWLFAPVRAPRLRAAAAGSALLLLGGSVFLSLDGQAGAWLRPGFLKGREQVRPLFERWSSYAYIAASGNPDVPWTAAVWGPSAVTPRTKVRQLALEIDANAGTVMTHFDGDLGAVDHLTYDVTNLAHHLRSNARVLVVGVGGGRDVLSALRFGQRSVLGVEVNADLLDALNRRFGDFTGHLDRDPRVRFVNDEARSYIARLEEPVDLIQVSLIDTWAATAAGAFVLTENALYTTEAWKVFLSRLSPNGLISFSRWYLPGEPAETQRLLSLASEALRESGAADPLAHLALVTNLPRSAHVKMGVATLLASPSPLSPSDLAALRATADALRFTILLSPEETSDPRLVALARGDVAGARSAFDLSPPTDDRPFFFHTLTIQTALRGGLAGLGDNNARAVRVLAALLVISLVMTFLFLILPLALTRERIPGSATPWLLYFLAIGFGFMCIEISQMQRLIVFLGHPVYGLTVLLFALLLSSGIGSALTPRIDSAAAARRQIWRLGALVAVLVAFGVVTPGVVESFRSEPTPLRIALAIAILAPIGLLLGMAFPLGLGAASLRHARLTPWFWGLNGAASVCASVVALAIAISEGISAALWTGVASYAAAAIALVVALRGEQDGGTARHPDRAEPSEPRMMMVEPSGIEPPTSALRTQRSPS